MTEEFSSETMQERKQWGNIFKYNYKNCPPRILWPAQKFSKIKREIKTF